MLNKPQKNLKITILNDTQLKSQGFNLIMEMGKASVHKPRFMVVEYCPNAKSKTICLVGKGVTFDSGSVNLKRMGSDFYQMKSDKLGATTVISLIKYFVEINETNINIIGLIPLIENAISGDVTYPGNIVKSYAGKTVEILNTDAEGRLILADALEYANKFKKIDYIIDIATLTGAAEHFHCDTTAAILTFNTDLKKMLEVLSEEVGERVYFLPAWPEYMELTESNVANVQNLDSDNCTMSGSFMAGMFLMQFVPIHLREKWIHFDVTHSYTKHFSNGNSTILILNLLKRLITTRPSRSKHS